MANINRDYLVILDVKSGELSGSTQMYFYNTDKNTSNIYVQLVIKETTVDATPIENATNYIVESKIVKPGPVFKDLTGVLVNEAEAIYEFDLPNDCTNLSGSYKIEFWVKAKVEDKDELVTSSKAKYKVKKSILTDLDEAIEDSTDYPLLLQLMEEVRVINATAHELDAQIRTLQADMIDANEEMKVNEEQRQSNEAIRETNEATRITQENARQEYLNAFDAKWEEYKTNTTNDITDYKESINTDISDFKSTTSEDIANYKESINTDISDFKSTTSNDIANYKSQIDAQEIIRETNEEQRKANEQRRIANEDERKIAERQRKANENVRIANEKERKSAEQSRVSDENARVANEEIRQTNEANREAAEEIRKANEEARITAETARVTEHEQMRTELNEVKAENAILMENDKKVADRMTQVEISDKRQYVIMEGLMNSAGDGYLKIEDTGNDTTLYNSVEGFVDVKNITGNTMVNSIKNPDDELTLNADINTSGQSVILTNAVDNGQVDVLAEGNTMVNVCDQQEAVAITKSYTVENASNHIPLQGEFDGKARPVVTGNTMVNVCDQQEAVAITKSYTVESGNHVALQGEFDGKARPVPTGNTLVNLVKNSSSVRNINSCQGTESYQRWTIYYYSHEILKNKDYTLIFTASNLSISNDTPLIFSLCGGNYETYRCSVKEGINTVLLNDSSAYSLNSLWIFFNPDTECSMDISNVVLLEGDYTNKPIPDYFEGMKSSFEDKVVPENLVNLTPTTIDSGYGVNINTVIEPSKKYSVYSKNLIGKNIKILFRDLNNIQPLSVGGTLSYSQFTGIATITTVSSGDFTNTCIRLFNNDSESITLDDLIVVEGDYTNYDFSDYDPTKAGKYRVDYKVTGKNKINPNYTVIENKYINSSGNIASSNNWAVIQDLIRVEQGKTYVLNKGVASNYTVAKIGCYDNNKNFIQTIGISNTSSYPIFDIPQGIRYIQVCFRDADSNYSLNNIQLEEGSTATAYEPYKEFTKTYYLNSPLLEGDTIEESGGNVYHIHRYGKVVLDGSDDERWLMDEYEEYINGRIFKTTVNSDVYRGSEYIEAYSDKYTSILSHINNSSITEKCIFTVKPNIICISDSSYTTLESFKTSIQSIPITVIYKLASPQYELISQSDTILTDSYVAGHLDFDTAVPVEKVEFNGWTNTLKYLYPNTDYILQFESDNIGELSFNLGATLLNQPIVKGINKFNITTPASMTNTNMFFTGIGFSASNIVVTPAISQDFGYFSGMSSAFEDGLVTDENDENYGKYKVEYKVTGKNKFHAQDMTINNDAGVEMKIINNDFYIKGTPSSNRWTYATLDNPIKLSPGKTYYITHNLNTLVLPQNHTKNILCDYPNILDEDAYIVKVIFLLDSNTTYDGFINFQIEEGSTGTAYEPYKEFTKTYYLNSPLLEGDTIEESGGNVYHVHRYGKVVLDGSLQLQYLSNLDKDNTVFFHRYNNLTGVAIDKVYCDKLQYKANADLLDEECVRVNSGFQVRITKNKLDSSDYQSSFNSWIEANPITVIYKLASPQYELISQSDTILTDSYVNGHLDFDTAVPVEKVVFNRWTIDTNYFYPNTKYIIQFEADNDGKIDKLLYGGEYISNQKVIKGVNKFSMTTINGSKILQLDGIGFNASNIVVTEATDKEFGYFSGMKSVGELEENKIEILSRNKNLFDYAKFCEFVDKRHINPEGYYYHGFRINVKPNTWYVFSREDNSGYGLGNHIVINDVENDYKSYGDFFTWIAHSTSTNLNQSTISFNTGQRNCIYINFTVGVNTPEETIANLKAIMSTFQLEEGSISTDYVSYAENKKQFLLNEPLRAVGDTKDRFVQIDGKWYVERNCGSYTITGNDEWAGDVCVSEADNIYQRYIDSYAFVNMSRERNYLDKIIADGLPTIERTSTISIGLCGYPYAQTAWVGQNWLYFNTSKTAEELKTYFTNKPTTVIYKLASPTYEPVEIAPTVNTYTDVTHITNNSTIPMNMPIVNSGYEIIAKPNTKYTVVGINSGRIGDSTIVNGSITTPATITDPFLRPYGTGETSKVMLLEGEPANIPGYFKGIKSVFEDKVTEDGKYAVEVKVVGKNKCDIDNMSFTKGYYLGEDGEPVSIQGGAYISDYINIKSIAGGNIWVSTTDKYDLTIAIYDRNKRFLTLAKTGSYERGISCPNNAYYLRFSCSGLPTKCLVYEDGDRTYEPYHETKQTLYLDEPLYNANNITIYNDKLGYWKNWDKVVLDGSGYYKVVNKNQIGYSSFLKDIDPMIVNLGKTRVASINDKFKTLTFNSAINSTNLNSECIYHNDSSSAQLIISISNSKLSTNDVTGFKQYLSENPITVVYQLKEPVFVPLIDNCPNWVIGSWDNCSIHFDSIIPLSATRYRYTGNVPSVVTMSDDVAETKSISDEQDAMIVDLATEVAVMEMMLM